MPPILERSHLPDQVVPPRGQDEGAENRISFDQSGVIRAPTFVLSHGAWHGGWC